MIASAETEKLKDTPMGLWHSYGVQVRPAYLTGRLPSPVLSPHAEMLRPRTR